MKNISAVVKVFGMILKYSAVLMAVVKGIEIVHQELEKIDLNEKTE